MIRARISLSRCTDIHRGSLTSVIYRDEVFNSCLRPYAGAIDEELILMDDAQNCFRRLDGTSVMNVVLMLRCEFVSRSVRATSAPRAEGHQWRARQDVKTSLEERKGEAEIDRRKRRRIRKA
ncbi:hypothetical protein AVEN_180506-1 [Araneus ventricosus]|uniref:Uncharacterized protein n=1 Tax=Araneus ventricosus TaxID=182803 RepID=A0A4Y2SXM6_ARAVE|nr:hypothetical protein AVEN_180506-1 [Araneus ventricosus]